jgi:glucan biosynthesis protein C
MASTNLQLPVSPQPGRRHDLDWLRIFAFGMLIFYHVGMFYVTWDWHVKSPSASTTLEPAMLLVNPWRLALLFFISGVAIRFATDKMPLREFLPNRFMRLFVPIVFGMLVVVAPQAYCEMRFKGEAGPGILDFWRDYVLFRQDFSIITPTWNHLWYVVYVLIYTLLFAPLLPVLRRLANGPAETMFAWIAKQPGWRLPLMPALPFLAYRLMLDPNFPTTHALFDDWANHAHCLTMLIFGYVAAKSPTFWRAVDKAMPVGIAVAVLLGVLLLVARLNVEAVGADDVLITAVRIGRVFYAWAVIVALLGLAQRFLNRQGKALSYLTEAVFPYYILHQTLIVVVGYWLIPYSLPAMLEATIVVGATLVGCVAGFEIIRRVPPLRPLFGLPIRERQAALAATDRRSDRQSFSSNVTIETSPSSAP